MNLTVYLGARMGNDPFYAEAVRDLGHWMGKEGHTLIYGGSKIGLMGILAQSVLEAGGHVIGVEPRFFVEAVLQHEGIDELIVVETMAERKAKMIELGDAFLAFPGGFGTLEEISEIMSHNALSLIQKPCLIYNLNHYYDPLRALCEQMLGAGFIDETGLSKVRFVSDLFELSRELEKTHD